MSSSSLWLTLACSTLLLQLGVLWSVLRLARIARTWWVWPAFFLALATLLARRVTVIYGLVAGGALPHAPATELAGFLVSLLQLAALWRLYDDLLEGRQAEARAEKAERAAAEAARLETERLFRTLFERSGDHVLLLEAGTDGLPVIVDANEAALAAHGYTRAEMLGMPISVLEPDAAPGIPAARVAAVLGGGGLLFETRHLRRDGSVLDVEVRIVGVPLQGRTLILAVERDITERRRFERDLAASEARLREAARMARIGYWEVDHRTGRQTWSEELFRMYGLDPEAGAPSLEALAARLHPEDRDHAIRSYREHLEGRSPRLWRPFRVVLPDGAVRHVHSQIATEYAPDGTPLRSFGTDQDVTGQVQLAQDREKALSLLSTTFESTSEGLLVVEQDGRVSTFNRRFLEMWDLEADGVRSLSAAALADLVVAKVADPKGFLRRISELQAAPEAVSTDEVELLDGRIYERYSCPRREAGEVSGRLLSFRDVTARRKAEEDRLALERQFHHLQRMESVGRLAGGISHDMNNVLAAIMSVTEVLGMKAPEHAAQLDLVMEAARRGRTLMRGLLAFARKEMEEADYFDLNDVVRREAELLSSTTLQKVRLELDLAPKLPRLMGSSPAIATALMNLCVNAVDAMPGGGTLTLRTRALGAQGVELEVEDTGQGMPPEVASRAMEPFFTTKPSGKGTGLGLSMVYGTVQAHGGSCEIHSRPGQGTRIRVTLPVVPGEPRGGQVPEPPAGHGPPAEACRILLVDDDPLVRRTIPEMLALQGHRVTAASGGAEGLALAEDGTRWDLMVLDLNMPGMDGLETLARLREAARGLPVLLTTGFLGEHTGERLAALGPVSVLLKPYTAAEIWKAVADLLAGGGTAAVAPPAPD